MAIYEVKTFDDIVDAIREELKIQSGDTNSINRIKRNVNMVYLQKVIPFKRWPWLLNSLDLSLPAAITTGTVSVTNESQSITFSSAPSYSVAGLWFSINGDAKRYRIYSHAAGNTAAVLEVPFEGATASASAYKVWRDFIVLPPQARESVEITRDDSSSPLQGVGFQEYRRIVNSNPKQEGPAEFYHTFEAVDPAPYATISGLPASATRSSAGLVRTVVFASTVASYLTPGERIRVTGAGLAGYNIESVVTSVSTTTITFTATTLLQESSTADTGITVTKLSQELSDESVRKILLHPAIEDASTTYHVDYIRKVYPLENDADEPVLPIEDRNVLVYGGLAMSWDRERNGEMANKNQLLFEQKLTQMAGRFEDSTDFPILMPNRTYLYAKRNQHWRRGRWKKSE